MQIDLQTVDKRSREPVAQAHVYLDGRPVTATNASGNAAIQVALWPALLRVTHVGYAPVELVVTAPRFVVVEMERANYALPEVEIVAPGRTRWPWWAKLAALWGAGKLLRWW